MALGMMGIQMPSYPTVRRSRGTVLSFRPKKRPLRARTTPGGGSRFQPSFRKRMIPQQSGEETAREAS